MSENQGNLCKHCKYRFRRVFIPTRTEEYEDADGNTVIADEDNIIVSNQCLLTEMDIDWEVTIECSHFIEREESNILPFFNHIK